MLSETEAKVLSAFFPEGVERSTKEIEVRSGYSHERVHSALKALAEKKVLSKKRVGKAFVYAIKRFDDTAYFSFAYYSINRKNNFIEKHFLAWKAVEEFIEKAKPEMVVLFGSYSKGEAKEKSDVDVLCVNGGQETEKIALSLRHKHNLKVSPVVVSKEDFRNIRLDNPELWGEILEFGIILKGQELFYGLVYPPVRHYDGSGFG